MTHDLIVRTLAYFNSKETLTEEEKELRNQFAFCDDEFPITSLSREDLKAKGYDTEKISDDQMERLADRMTDDYCDQLYWQSLDIMADYLEFPKK